MALNKERKIEISVTINGKKHNVETPSNYTLQEMLKHCLGFTGAKKGCGRGECGSCTVIMNGKTVNGCLTLAGECDGATIETVEGEANDGKLTALQKSFVKHGAIQCGFCTPGMIMSAKYLLDHNPCPTREEILEGIAGNLCRCTGYEAIIDAIADVAESGNHDGCDCKCSCGDK
jgi:carbon-monoxide dehydrogenase small subunit